MSTQCRPAKIFGQRGVVRFQDLSGARENMLKLRSIGLSDYAVLESGQRIAGFCRLPPNVCLAPRHLTSKKSVLNGATRHAAVLDHLAHVDSYSNQRPRLGPSISSRMPSRSPRSPPLTVSRPTGAASRGLPEALWVRSCVPA